MIKKLVGFLTVLCMSFFIAGCSSTPDVSGTYLRLDSNNKPSGAVVLKSVGDNAYDCSLFINNYEQTKMEKDWAGLVVLNVEQKTLEQDKITPPDLFFNKDYTSITRTARSFSGERVEYIYKKLSNSEIKQYQHLFE